jgi:hypothetical protein
MMSGKPIDMSKIRNVIKLYTQGKSKVFISDYLKLSRNTVKKYIKQFISSKKTFEELSALSDLELESLFSGQNTPDLSPKLATLYSFFPTVEKQLKKVGMTRELLWLDYKSKHPDGYQLSYFVSYTFVGVNVQTSSQRCILTIKLVIKCISIMQDKN